MKHTTLCLSLLALGCATSSSAWALCVNVVEKIGSRALVTITAGPNDHCTWSDNNPDGMVIRAVTANAVGLSINASIIGSSIMNDDGHQVISMASCTATSVTGCSADRDFSVIGESPFQERQCLFSNNNGALVAIGTCEFE